MTTHDDLPDDNAELVRFLEAYTPTGLPAGTWAALREDAIKLVLEAGPPAEERARKDLEVLADVAEHLSRTSVVVTLENLMKDTTLVTFDGEQAAIGHADGTRENKRGRFRRLQAAHRGVPWRKERRADGERIGKLVQPEVVDVVRSLLPADGSPGRHGAGALQASVDDARRRRRGIEDHTLEGAVWEAARKYTRSRDAWITKRDLDAMATYEVLTERAPGVCCTDR